MSIETTGIKVESYEAGLDHMRRFPLDPKFLGTFNYAMLMEEDDGSYTVVERIGMPCWGALREYERGNRPNDPWPGDLRADKHLFPAHGKPVAVAAFFPVTPAKLPKLSNAAMNYSVSLDDWNNFIEFCFDPSISPWRQALKNVELIRTEHGNIQGCVFVDTNIDPNVMLALLRTNVRNGNRAHNFCQYLRNNPDVDPRIAYLKCANMDAYMMSGRVVLDSFFNGQSTIPMEGTFYERTSYNRPDIQYVWGGKDNAGVIINKMSVDQLKEALNGITGVVQQGN